MIPKKCWCVNWQLKRTYVLHIKTFFFFICYCCVSSILCSTQMAKTSINAGLNIVQQRWNYQAILLNKDQRKVWKGQTSLSLKLPSSEKCSKWSAKQTNFIPDHCVFPYDTIPASLPPQGGSAWFVDERRSTAVTLLLQSRSLVPRFTACPKQMGDSGNWHRGLQHAVMALSPEIPHLYLSSCCLLSVC